MTFDKQDFFEGLLTELSFRVEGGIPNLKNPKHLEVLGEIFDDMELYSVGDILIRNLLNEQDGYKHIGAGIYVADRDVDRDGKAKEGAKKYRKDGEGESASYTPISDDEAEDIKKKQGEEGEKAAAAYNKSQEKGDDGELVGDEQPEEEESKGAKVQGSDMFSHAPDVKKDKEGDDFVNSKPKENGYIGNKDKSLKEGDPSETEEYKREVEPSDEEFEKRNEKHKNPVPPSPFKVGNIIKNPKFPKRYITILERMVNSRLTKATKKWEHFSDIPGGQGQIKAQFGELLTMIGSTLDDNEFDELIIALEEYEKNLVSQNSDLFKKKNKQGREIDNPGSRIIDSSWLNAAKNNRQAILGRLEKQYGKGTKIIGAAWDTKNEVEAMGMSDYEDNKGFSSDCYFKILIPNGEQLLDEVSLKKSVKVNFLNSGAGIFIEWDPDLPDEINQELYRKKARKRNIDWISQNKDEVKIFLNSPEGASIRKLMESKGLTFEQALEGNSRDKQNVLFQTIKLMSKTNESAKSIIDQDNREHAEFTEKAIIAITENDKMREGMLEEIRSEFPLKAVSDGEETMAIGPNSLDKETMKNIFGTDDYDEIKEKLVAKPGPPPFIGYRVDTGDEVIPVAKIVIREDGRGYGGQFKFEMVLHDGFAKRLEQAQKQVYGTE